MILHEEDWYKYPDAIADVSTKNDTFIHYCNVLKSMGVKNYLWPLALEQRELKGIDPRRDDLPLEIELLIDQECRSNPWYYLREVHRVPRPGSLVPSIFKANRSNMCLMWCFLNHVDIAIVQPRQTGKTTGSSSCDTWIMEFGALNALINLFTKDNTLRIETVASIKEMIKFIPDYLRAVHPDDRDNQSEVTVLKYRNRMKVAVGQKSPDDANKIARGLASQIFKSDEGPFCPNADITIPVAISSGNSARDTAAETGGPYGNIFTTTAGNLSTTSGRWLYDLFTTSVPWDERHMDAGSQKSLIKSLLKLTRNYKAMCYATFSHRQLGYSDEWLFNKMATAAARGESAEQDYLNIWGMGGVKNPIDPDDRRIMEKHRRLPNYIQLCENEYQLLWYIDEKDISTRMSRGKFVMGKDTSDAIGRDNIAWTVVDVETFEVICTLVCNETNLNNFALFLAKYLVKFVNIVWVPEAKSSARSIIDTVCTFMHSRGQDPFKRIFNLIVNDKELYKTAFYEISQYDVSRRDPSLYVKHKRMFGFNTAKASRDLLFSMVLKTACARSAAIIFDNQLINDLLGLVDNGTRVDHGSDGHDDTVISWLLCHWFMMYAKNLSYYGIDPAIIGTKLNLVSGEYETAEERELAQYEAERVLNIKESLRQAMEVLQNSTDAYARHRMEMLITSLMTQLPDDDDDVMGIDAVLNKIKNDTDQAVKRRGFVSMRNHLKF